MQAQQFADSLLLTLNEISSSALKVPNRLRQLRNQGSHFHRDQIDRGSGTQSVGLLHRTSTICTTARKDATDLWCCWLSWQREKHLMKKRDHCWFPRTNQRLAAEGLLAVPLNAEFDDMLLQNWHCVVNAWSRVSNIMAKHSNVSIRLGCKLDGAILGVQKVLCFVAPFGTELSPRKALWSRLRHTHRPCNDQRNFTIRFLAASEMSSRIQVNSMTYFASVVRL